MISVDVNMNVVNSSPKGMNVVNSSPKGMNVVNSSPKDMDVINSSPKDMDVINSSPDIDDDLLKFYQTFMGHKTEGLVITYPTVKEKDVRLQKVEVITEDLDSLLSLQRIFSYLYLYYGEVFDLPSIRRCYDIFAIVLAKSNHFENIDDDRYDVCYDGSATKYILDSRTELLKKMYRTPKLCFACFDILNDKGPVFSLRQLIYNDNFYREFLMFWTKINTYEDWCIALVNMGLNNDCCKRIFERIKHVNIWHWD